MINFVIYFAQLKSLFMKNLTNFKWSLAFMCFFVQLHFANAQFVAGNYNLTIVNTRACPITVNWEIGNCDPNCPSPPCLYCNDYADPTIVTAPYIYLPDGGNYTVDISTLPASVQNCGFYTIMPVDLYVGLIEIDGMLFGTWGGISCGSPPPCFST